jgi:hypothetical protein
MNEEKKDIYFLALAFLGIGFVFYSFLKKNDNSSYEFQKNKNINKHLSAVHLRQENQRMQRQLDNSKTKSLKGEFLTEEKSTLPEFDVELENGSSYKKIQEEMGDVKIQENESLSDKMTAVIAEDQQKEDYNKELERQYVQQYKEKARQQGFDVKVDKNLNVIEVKRIPNSVYNVKGSKGSRN